MHCEDARKNNLVGPFFKSAPEEGFKGIADHGDFPATPPRRRLPTPGAIRDLPSASRIADALEAGPGSRPGWPAGRCSGARRVPRQGQSSRVGTSKRRSVPCFLISRSICDMTRSVIRASNPGLSRGDDDVEPAVLQFFADNLKVNALLRDFVEALANLGDDFRHLGLGWHRIPPLKRLKNGLHDRKRFAGFLPFDFDGWPVVRIDSERIAPPQHL